MVADSSEELNKKIPGLNLKKKKVEFINKGINEFRSCFRNNTETFTLEF